MSIPTPRAGNIGEPRRQIEAPEPVPAEEPLTVPSTPAPVEEPAPV